MKNIVFALVLAVLFNPNSAQACGGADDAHPHSENIERLDDQTLRVHRPYHVIRFGGGAPGQVFYSRFVNRNKICRNLVISHSYGNFQTLKGSYVPRSLKIADEVLPSRMSLTYFDFQQIFGADDNYDEYRKNPKLGLHRAIESIDCRIEGAQK